MKIAIISAMCACVVGCASAGDGGGQTQQTQDDLNGAAPATELKSAPAAENKMSPTVAKFVDAKDTAQEAPFASVLNKEEPSEIVNIASKFDAAHAKDLQMFHERGMVQK